MSATLDPNGKVNLSSASIMLVEQSQHSLDVLSQIFMGFGARNLHRACNIEEAKTIAQRTTLDLLVIDPNLKEGDGHDFIRWLRRLDHEVNRTIPVIVISANSSKHAVVNAQNAGSSFYVVKPIKPASLLERILWIVRDGRPFYDGPNFAGPDRRFKFEGPPPGEQPRRDSDISEEIGDASEPNMSQSEIDMLLKPQKVAL